MGTTVRTGEKGTPGTLASWWRSRYGSQLLFEVAICGALLLIYRAIRSVNKSDLGTAFANARDIVKFERWIGLPFEDDLQAFLLDHPTKATAHDPSEGGTTPRHRRLGRRRCTSDAVTVGFSANCCVSSGP